MEKKYSELFNVASPGSDDVFMQKVMRKVNLKQQSKSVFRPLYALTGFILVLTVLAAGAGIMLNGGNTEENPFSGEIIADEPEPEDVKVEVIFQNLLKFEISAESYREGDTTFIISGLIPVNDFVFKDGYEYRINNDIASEIPDEEEIPPELLERDSFVFLDEYVENGVLYFNSYVKTDAIPSFGKDLMYLITQIEERSLDTSDDFVTVFSGYKEVNLYNALLLTEEEAIEAFIQWNKDEFGEYYQYSYALDEEPAYVIPWEDGIYKADLMESKVNKNPSTWVIQYGFEEVNDGNLSSVFMNALTGELIGIDYDDGTWSPTLEEILGTQPRG